PDRACYQSIVRGRRVIDHIYNIEEIEADIQLRVHRYPSLPIADMLGLNAKWMNPSGEVAVDILEPIRPFWMKLALTERLGENLLPSPPPEDPVRNERNLTSDKAWYSEEPKDWEPDVDWYSPEARQDPPSCRPAS